MKKLLALLLFFTHSLWASHPSELTLYFIPSPFGIDWTSPSSLAWSAFKNKISFRSRFMGHVFVELNCQGEKHLTGMRGKNFDYLRQLLINGRGLGVLYHSFDGMLEDKSESEEEIKELAQTGERLNFIRFNLNQGQCQRALTYLKEYREKDVGRYYGLANRPLYGEGAGCSAFGASFLEVLGLTDQDILDGWTHTIKIPMSFAGPPLKVETVNLLNLMLNAKSWASDREPYRTLKFWSPDLMYQWVKNKISSAEAQKIKVISLDKAQGLWLDKSYLPAPERPIWQQHLNQQLIMTKKTEETLASPKK